MLDDSVKTIVGLEIHVQLQTESKLFCRCATQFGAPPNTLVCPVCLGEPGSLPVLNRRAIELVILAGLAMNCRIELQPRWDRKHYFYPDLPKGYQISQWERPLCGEGFVDRIDLDHPERVHRVRIERAHLEEDAGKSLHGGSAEGTRIDLNRAGTPLLEIVTRPDLTSGSDARSFLSELKLILTDLGVSDCNMQEGNLRVDANVNLQIDVPPAGHVTPIVEIKNLNSFRAVERSIDYETGRQWAEWKDDRSRQAEMLKQTRGWDDAKGVTFLQRTKEQSADYRYFPEPDLPPIALADAEIESLRNTIGPLPSDVRRELLIRYALPPYDADVIVNQGRAFVAYFREVAEQVADPRQAATWLQQDILRTLNERQIRIDQYPLRPDRLARFLNQLSQSKIPSARARDVLQQMVDQDLDVEQAIEQLEIVALSPQDLDAVCQQVIDQHPKIAEQIRQGKTKAVGALIGRARQLEPNADPQRIRRLLLKNLANPDSA